MIKEEEEGRPWSAHVSVERDPPPAGDVIVLSTDLAGGADPVSGKVLRVRPKTSSRITELSQHEADGGEFQECKRAAVEIFPVLGEAPAAVEPGDRAFDDPTLG